MKVVDIQIDKRSDCKSVLTIMTLDDYKKVAYQAFIADGNMEGQRGVIKKSSAAMKIRKRMQTDFVNGAVFPQVVIGALNISKAFNIGDIISISDFDLEAISIIDGMQRSNIYFNNIDGNEKREIRVEFWIAEDSIQLLYRMLVLNTGQMPWNTRRQIEVVFSNLSKNMTEMLFAKYSDLIGKVDIYGIDDAKQRREAGKYHKSDIIEAYLAFNTRNVKVKVSDELADEFQRFDMMETIEKPKSLDFFVDTLAMMCKLDLAFAKFSMNDSEGQFREGRDIFGSVTACIGFIVAGAEFIMGKSSVDRTVEIQEEKAKEFVDKIEEIIRKTEEMALVNTEDYLGRDTLNRICNGLPKSKIGDELRRLFKNAFMSMIRYDGFTELPDLADFWRE
ncbi:hypothetical protein [Azotosporobacter soli]|uniref:hypothetical protein n=1 Tax=Azotosporobacter soli TaxID=3055040 RepID=UPI0031FE75AB